MPGVEVAYDDFSNPEILLPDWVAEGQLEQHKVRRKGYQSAVTSVIFEVTNEQPIAFSQFAHDYAPHFRGEYCAAKAAAS